MPGQPPQQGEALQAWPPLLPQDSPAFPSVRESKIHMHFAVGAWALPPSASLSSAFPASFRSSSPLFGPYIWRDCPYCSAGEDRITTWNPLLFPLSASSPTLSPPVWEPIWMLASGLEQRQEQPVRNALLHRQNGRQAQPEQHRAAGVRAAAGMLRQESQKPNSPVSL